MNIIKPLTFYFFLAYLFSWIVFILLALNHHGVIYLFTDDSAHVRVGDVWHAIGAIGPALSAIISFKIFYTKNHFRKFLKSYTTKGVTAAGWILAFSPLLYLVMAIAISSIMKGQAFSIAGFFHENNLLTLFNLLAWLLPSFTYGIFEEAGWRGFALPVLQTKYSAFAASTILTVFWVGWHVPSLFYRYQLNVPMLIGFVIGIYAGSLYLTHIFNFTKGSLLVVTIWHITWDIVSMIGKEGLIAAVMSTIIMMLAAFVLVKYKGKNLAPYARTFIHSSS